MRTSSLYPPMIVDGGGFATRHGARPAILDDCGRTRGPHEFGCCASPSPEVINGRFALLTGRAGSLISWSASGRNAAGTCRIPTPPLEGRVTTCRRRVKRRLSKFLFGQTGTVPFLTGRGVTHHELLVVGSSLAMGMQAAASRYIGPSGTPTNFLTGTLTNWVSGMVELHKPTWNSTHALQLLAMVAAAGANSFIQRIAPGWSYVMPVALAGLAVALLAVATRRNHGGLRKGGPQIVPQSRRPMHETATSQT